MGTKWMIEQVARGYPEWWTGSGWSSDCHQGKQFDSRKEGEAFMWSAPDICSSCEGISITEHIFMSPITTPENLN